jgi:hypothetical protein
VAQLSSTAGAAISAWFAHSQVSPIFLVGKLTIALHGTDGVAAVDAATRSRIWQLREKRPGEPLHRAAREPCQRRWAT